MELPYNVWAVQPFQNGLTALRDAAAAGLKAIENDIRSLEQSLIEYEQSGEYDGQRDEDGQILWEFGDMFRSQIGDAEVARMELRKGLAIAAYHYWERAVQRLHKVLGGQKHLRDWESIRQSAEQSGFAIDPALQRVVTLANTLKHSNEKHGVQLLAEWPDLFPRGISDPANVIDWASAIELSDAHLRSVFTAVAQSGPQRRSGGPRRRVG